MTTPTPYEAMTAMRGEGLPEHAISARLAAMGLEKEDVELLMHSGQRGREAAQPQTAALIEAGVRVANPGLVAFEAVVEDAAEAASPEPMTPEQAAAAARHLRWPAVMLAIGIALTSFFPGLGYAAGALLFAEKPLSGHALIVFALVISSPLLVLAVIQAMVRSPWPSSVAVFLLVIMIPSTLRVSSLMALACIPANIIIWLLASHLRDARRELSLDGPGRL
jgi:hypothetical protein